MVRVLPQDHHTELFRRTELQSAEFLPLRGVYLCGLAVLADFLRCLKTMKTLCLYQVQMV